MFGAFHSVNVESPSVTAGVAGLNTMGSIVTPPAVVHGFVITTLKSTVPSTSNVVVPPLFPLGIVKVAEISMG